ncbi:MAG TPA: right-handed parallel beta-helix repeat-containing protein [Rhodothermales bacterium]|nr:right-handed parallel beta-helix repeat-containing protein [Rhodothermales bacterium]
MHQRKKSKTVGVVIFLCCLCAGFVRTAQAQVAEQDRAALIALYEATTVNEPWFHEYGFSQAVDSDPDNDVPVENWQTNDPIEIENGRVVYVNLYGNNLNGTLPDEICNMDALRELDLGVNKLSGPIPACIGNMTTLTKLDIAGLGNFGNKMSGSLPESLGELENLEILDLQFNELTGSIPVSLGDAVNLKELRLNNNQLSGSIPASLGALVNLQTLRLFSNQLTGSIPEALGALSNLQELHLSNNQLTGPLLASLGNLAALQVLDLHVNQLSGTIPATLGNLGLLTKLDLGGNQLSGMVPADLGNMSSLQDLSLAGNALTDFEPGSYAGWNGLRFQVSSNQLASLPPLNGPTAAYVSGNKLSFADLEPVAQLGLEDNNFFYANQQPTIDVRQSIEDGVVVLSVEEDGTETMYQWQRLDSDTGRYVLIDGATETSFAPAEPGTYRCRLTHPLLPSLTLLSQPAMMEGVVIIVNSTGDAQDEDVNDGVCDTGDTVTGSDGQEVAECTLRAAIQMANLPGNMLTPLIAFDIPGENVPTIAPGEDLPRIEQPVRMDGTTQAAGSVLIQGEERGNGLVVHTGGSGSRIEGLIVSGFSVAIGLLDAGNNTVEQNEMVGNGTGISIEGMVASSDNVVRDNVVGSNRNGVFLAGAAHDNTIVDNYIGTERDGRSPLENTVGVWIAQVEDEKPRGNILRNNVISANEEQGVLMQGVGVGNRIEANKIGVDQTGTQVLSNGQEGIRLKKASGVAIRSNVIAGNMGAGVRWDDSERIELIGNYIGTNADGQTGLGNEDAGMLGFSSVHTAIRDNVIAANFDSGIRLSTSSDCTIQHNWIGTDPLGRVLGNGAHGVLLEESPCQVGYDNTIAYNQESGIFLRDVEGAFISRNILVGNLTGLTVLRGAQSIVSFNTFSEHHRHVDVIEAEDLVFWYNEGIGGLGTSTGIHLTASSATIEGNLLTDDAGDAITLEDGSTATVTGNNIFGNAGMGLNNLTPSVMVTATGNWWGDASGPGGEGPGTGDEVSAGVDMAGWLDEMVAVVAAAEADEILLPTGEADTISVFLQNWQHRTDALDVTISNTESWLQSTATLAVSLNGTTGAVAPLAFAVSASTPNGATSTVEITATSQSDADHTATTTFTLIAESATLAQVLVAPSAVEVAPGDTVLFDAFGLDQFNRTVEIMPTWASTGGEIDEDGIYVAGDATGEFIVTATDPGTGLSGTARVGNGVSVIVEEETEVPDAFHLAPNYPNPFNPETTIGFTVPQQAQVRLVVYDLLGREVAVLVDGGHPAGIHTVRFDARALPSGMYLYRMQAGSYSETRAMVLLR